MKRPITVSLSAWISIFVSGYALMVFIGIMLWRPDLMSNFIAFEQAKGINVPVNLAVNLSSFAVVLVSALLMLKHKRAAWFGYLAGWAVLMAKSIVHLPAFGIPAICLMLLVCTKPALAYFGIIRIVKSDAASAIAPARCCRRSSGPFG